MSDEAVQESVTLAPEARVLPSRRASAVVSRLLIVVQDDEDRALLEALLDTPATPALTARSGAEALEILHTHDVALVLADLELADMDGAELVERLQGSLHTRHLPVVFLTGAGQDVGAVDFLTRPIDEAVLRRKCGVFLELHRRRVELDEQQRMNALLLAAVGHDLRNPLGAVLMASELLGEMCTDADQQSVVLRIRSSGRNMSRLIDDLMDTRSLRLGKGLVLDRPHKTDLRLVAERAVSELSSSTSRREVLVGSSGDTSGIWDQERLVRVLANLLASATRYGRPGTPIGVTIDGATADGVRVRVRYQGQVPADLLEHLWDPFQPGRPGDGDPTPGVGLGLYVARHIALAHGGRMEARLDAGTTELQLWLPRTAPAE